VCSALNNIAVSYHLRSLYWSTKLEIVAIAMHCNLKPTTPRIYFASLKSVNISVPVVAVLERFYCWYLTLRCNIDLWPCDLTFDLLYQILTTSNNPRRSYCDFSISPNDLEHVPHVVTCCAPLWYNFHQVSKFKVGQPFRSLLITFQLQIRYVTLYDLDLRPIGIERL